MKNPFPEEIYLKRTRYHEEDVRGAYFRDQTAIIHSTAFRRLKHKTQVFFAPENDHICTRIEHVMHVATIAKSICKGLNRSGWDLDVEMAFAIGLGHDLGHAPFGHDGESVLNRKLGKDIKFIHEINSYRVVEYLANNGKGLNLTFGVKDGIICHNGEKYEQFLKPAEKPNQLDKINNRKVKPSSFEGCVVRFSDKIAYLGRDIEDAITAGFISKNDIPEKVRKKIGTTNSEIIDVFVNDVINTSKNLDVIGFSDERFELIKMLRTFNYKNIYLSDKNHAFPFAKKILDSIFDFLMNLLHDYKTDYTKYQQNGNKLIMQFGQYLENMKNFYRKNEKNEVIITDFISGMTDLYALDAMKQITIPKSVV